PRMNLPDATRRCKRPRAFPLDSCPVCRISSNLLFRTLFARRACRFQELTPKCQAELEQVARYGPRFRWLPCRLHITRTGVCRGRCHLTAIRPYLICGGSINRSPATPQYGPNIPTSQMSAVGRAGTSRLTFWSVPLPQRVSIGGY